MNAGRLDTKVSLMQPSIGPGTAGDPHDSASFSEYTTRRAEVKHLRGNELDQARAISEEVQTKITVRHDSKTAIVKADWRVHVGQEVYHITHALPIPGGRPEKVELYCKRHG